VATAALLLPHGVWGRNRLIDLGRAREGRYAATVVQPVRPDEGGVAPGVHDLGRARIADQLTEYFSRAQGDDFAAAMMRVDFESYLPGDILTKVDRTSMAVSLEARVPLLDFDLVDLALSIPGELRVTGLASKRLFRRAIKGIVPDPVLDRPKRGFEMPLASWFRGPLRHRLEDLRAPSAAIEQFAERSAVDRLVKEHASGRRDHSAMLWRLMALDYWLGALRSGKLGRRPDLKAS
jgi:asparagine synthase (glutamine-hydrolysing)